MLLLLSTGFAVLRVKFEGEDLGDNIASILNKRMRGRIEIGSIEWSTGALKQVVTGGWVPVTMRNIRVWDDCALSSDVAGALDELRTGDPNEDCTPDERPDPEPNSKRKPRKLLVRTDLITAEVDIHALMFGKHDFVFRNLWIHGGEAVIEETDEPYPLHAYDRTIVSIVTAFYPRMSAGFRAGIYADSAPPIFDLRDIHIANLNLTIHMNPYVEDGVFGYVTTIRMEGVNVDSGPEPQNDSFLYMDPTDPLVAKFYLKLGVTAKRGVVRIFDEGPRDTFRMPVPQVAGASAAREVYPPAGRSAKYQVALADIQLNRLAHMPTDWARKNFVANTLELDVQARTLPCATPENASPDPATGAMIRFSGELQNWFDRPFDGAWNLALDVQNFGPTLRSCIKSNIGGDDLHGRITLTGPFIANPAVGLDLKNLDFDVPLRADEEPLRLTLAEVHGRIDMVNEQGYIDKTKALIRGGKEPGEVEIAATFGLKPYNANATIEIVKAIDVGRFLPDSVSRPVGKYLQGRLRAKGDAMYGFALEDFDLALGPTPTQKAIRVHKGRLFTDDDFDSIQIQKVHVDAGRSHAVFDGFVNILANDMKVRIEGEFPDLDVWMKRFGLPAFFKSAGGGVIIIQGPLDKPRINIATELGGVPCLDKLRIVDMEYSSDTGMVDIRKITSAGLGGELTGSGRIRAPDKDKPGDRARIEILKLAGKRIDASRLCGLKGTVKGTLETLDLELANTTIDPNRGALDWLESTKLYAKSDKLDVLGDKYSSVGICVNRKDDQICRPRDAYLDGDDLAQCEQGKKGNGFCAVATATRDAGGLFDATVVKLPAVKSSRLGERLGGSIALHDLPLAILQQFAGSDMAGGLASATLHLAGSPLAPQANGALQLLRAWAAHAFFGDAQLAVEPATIGTNKPAIAIRGTLLAGRLRIDAVVGTAAPYPVELAISGRRIELDVLLGLQQRLGLPEPLQAWVTGTITVKTELAPVTPIEPEAWIELTEMRATVTHRSADGRLTPLTLSVFDRSNGQRPAMSLRATPSSLELACKDPGAKGGRVECPTFVATPAGILEIRGSASPKRISLLARGDLDLRQIAPLFDTTFEELKGVAALTASVSGTYEQPNYEAELRLENVSAQPVGGDTILEAPSGLIRLANGSLGFTDVKVQVRDRHRDEAGELHIKGNITLDGLKPVGWGILIDGKIAGKMLLVAVPSAVSQASGLARIEGDLLLSGKGPRPTISGTIDFAPLPVCPKGEERMADGAECRQATEQHRPLTIIPRGVRRELTFATGSVDIDTEAVGERRTYKISLNGISTSIDGEGTLSGIDGRIELRDGVLTKLDVRLDADDIPFRVPGTLDLILTARRITIDKASEHSTLEVGGIITIIDGTYNRNFAITDQLVSIAAPATLPTKPFWEEYPTLGSANLDLDLEVRRFAVKNNIAQIELSGDLEISNTPRDPRLAGRISVARGRFRVPGTRAPFTETSGSIDFAENERAGNPELNVESDALYRDQSGQEHLITLSLTGKLEQLQWDLKTSTGYNKSQTLSLLVLGRNPEQLRRSLGDQSLGSDPTTGDPTTNPSGGFADQIVKDLAGDWVSSLLGDSLEKYTPFDVLRIEIGFGSIGFHVEKKVLENMRLLGDTEQTIRGNTVNGRAEFDGPKGIRVQLGYLNKNFNDPAEQDIEDRSLKLVKIFIWP
ncbi:MAG: translocation/assembly module TamB domain-containing protein [Deltaproteobacteria bacterium]|nr:translocation/assembly module TamB domain-containing protein [Deltaproteobacteria bacterium]